MSYPLILAGLPMQAGPQREAAIKAAEQFLDRKPSCRSSYRTIARRFFVWAEAEELTLSSLTSQDVRRYHWLLWNESGPNVALASLSVTERLLGELAVACGLPENPAAGVTLRGYPPFKHVERTFRTQWGVDATDEVTEAAMVMAAPAALATFSLKAIRAWTQYPMETVERLGSRLYETGIWWKDESREGLRCEWIDPECEHPDFAMLFDAFVVVGLFVRDDELRYSLPAEKYADAGRRKPRGSVTRTIREERRETVTIREATETIVAGS